MKQADCSLSAPESASGKRSWWTHVSFQTQISSKSPSPADGYLQPVNVQGPCAGMCVLHNDLIVRWYGLSEPCHSHTCSTYAKGLTKPRYINQHLQHTHTHTVMMWHCLHLQQGGSLTAIILTPIGLIRRCDMLQKTPVALTCQKLGLR